MEFEFKRMNGMKKNDLKTKTKNVVAVISADQQARFTIF